MRLLWILMSGINYLLLLLCSALAVTGSSISPRTTDVLSGQTSEDSKTTTAATEKASSTTSPVGGTSTSNDKTIQLVTITTSTVSTLSTGPLPSDNGKISTTPSVTPGIMLSANTLKTTFGVTPSTQNSPLMNSTVLTGNTLSTVLSSFTTVATRETQPSSTSSTNTLLTKNIATTSTGVSVGTGTTISETKTTQLPGKQLLKSWEIILISLAVTATTVGGFIGCCYFCRTSSTSYSI